MQSDFPSLRNCSFGARFGISLLILVLFGGFAASAAYIGQHHAPRDQRDGFSMDDLRGVYHGLDRPSNLRSALESGHPADLGEADRKVLVDWLAGDRISQDYDNLDLGDASPAEILDRGCLNCHSRNSEDAIGQSLPLEFWDDVKALAYSYEVAPLPEEILVVTTHTHALTLGTIGLLAALLVLCTRYRRLSGILIAFTGLGLFIDLSCWWLTRNQESLVFAIVLGGAMFGLAVTLQLLLVLLDLWLPKVSSGE